MIMQKFTVFKNIQHLFNQLNLIKLMIFSLLILIFILFLTISCSRSQEDEDLQNNLLYQILDSHSHLFSDILKNAIEYRVQILYTQIDRDEQNHPHFTSYSYHLNEEDYFYPASSVKLAAAVLALEKLNMLSMEDLNKYTYLKIDSANSNQTAVNEDSTAENYLPSIAQYIKKIFLVSDNDAFNRLYEFLGQQYFNQTLWKKGFKNVKIIRRLEVRMSPEENAATNPFTFFEGEKILYHQPAVINSEIYKVKMKNVKQGKGFYKGNKLVNEALDFSHSNYISLKNLQNILKAIIFPQVLAQEERFNLSDGDYRFLYKYMSLLPRESGIPAYQDTSKYHDSYIKYFIFGDTRKQMPAHIRIYNKSGQAYGYLIDNAYVVDFKKKIEFLLSAVIQVNENEIYNDDTYEYDEIGIPFLANLGKVIYQYELSRDRSYVPDFQNLVIN
jgi:hypothetical protein